MHRRRFLALLGGAAAAPPAGAQQSDRVRRVGVLSNPSRDDAEMQSPTAAFVNGLQELGWTVGRNLQIDFRWSNGDAERLRAHARELVALGPDVVLATSDVSIVPLLQASRTVQIVFAQFINYESLSPTGPLGTANDWAANRKLFARGRRNDAETIPERVAAKRDRGMLTAREFLLAARAGLDCSCQERVEVVDVEVDVNRRPVSLVATNIVSSRRWLGTCRFLHQADLGAPTRENDISRNRASDLG